MLLRKAVDSYKILNFPYIYCRWKKSYNLFWNIKWDSSQLTFFFTCSEHWCACNTLVMYFFSDLGTRWESLCSQVSPWELHWHSCQPGNLCHFSRALVAVWLFNWLANHPQGNFFLICQPPHSCTGVITSYTQRLEGWMNWDCTSTSHYRIQISATIPE